MFEKFGEFDSAEEMNRAAAAQLAEGDTEAIFVIAAENGIDRAEAEDYIDGVTEEFVTPRLAALGKLDVEARELKPYEIMEDWLTYIKQRCMEDIEMAKAVRRSGKSLKYCIADLLKWSMKNQKEVDKDSLKACGISQKVTLGIPGMGRAKKIITEYYLGK